MANDGGHSKRELKRAWREQQRAVALASLPLAIGELDAMFDLLRNELAGRHCDRTRRLVRSWLESRGDDVARVFAWLDEHGGFCDCEVLANVPQVVAEAKAARGATIH